jgi:hypothetical protein
MDEQNEDVTLIMQGAAAATSYTDRPPPPPRNLNLLYGCIPCVYKANNPFATSCRHVGESIDRVGKSCKKKRRYKEKERGGGSAKLSRPTSKLGGKK